MGCNFYDSIKWCPGAVLKRTIWLLSDFKRYFTYLLKYAVKNLLVHFCVMQCWVILRMEVSCCGPRE